MPTSDDPRNVAAALLPVIPIEIVRKWDRLEGVGTARAEFAYQNPTYAHLLTAGVTLPIFRKEVEWILEQFDEGLPEGAVIDIGAGAGAGVTMAVVALATKPTVIACEPVSGAIAAIAHVADVVGVDINSLEAPVSALASNDLESVGVAVAQSILSYLGFGDERDKDDSKQGYALTSTLSEVGETLVVEHIGWTKNTGSYFSAWGPFIWAMADAGMYPVWETARFVTGENVLTVDTPRFDRSLPQPSKLCLRISRSGDPRRISERLEALLANP